MSASQSLVVGITVAVIFWLLKLLVTSIFRRKALNDALISDIKSRIDQWQTNKAFLDKLIDHDLAEGKTVPYTALYEPSKITLFDALLSELISLLPDHFAKISKSFTAFKEAELLLVGILRDLTIWKDSNKKLSDADLIYMKAKRDRISSYVTIFSKNRIDKLRDLPKDYRGIHGTEVITGTISNTQA